MMPSLPASAKPLMAALTDSEPTQLIAGKANECSLAYCLDWREPGEGKRLNGAKAREYDAAGILYGPRGAPFESIEELQLVLGITPELYARLAPSLTVYSQTPWVDPTFAPKDVLSALAGMGGEPVSTVLAERGTGSTGGVMVGHAFTISAVVQGSDRLSVARTAVIRLSGAPGAPLGIYQWQ